MGDLIIFQPADMRFTRVPENVTLLDAYRRLDTAPVALQDRFPQRDTGDECDCGCCGDDDAA